MSRIEVKIDGHNVNFCWSFARINLGVPYLQYVECALLGNELECKGYAEGISLESTKRRAFSEAWERWWMKYASHFGISGSLGSESSNGFAAHRTFALAAPSATNELVERAEVLSSWQKPNVWRRLNGLYGEIAKAIFKATVGEEWSPELYLVSSNCGFITLIGLGVHRDGGVVFDSTTSVRLNFNSILGLCLSLVKSTSFAQYRADYKFPDVGGPMDHAKFYFSKERAKAFDVHRFSEGTGRGVLADFNLIRVEEIANYPGTPVVVRAIHPAWPKISWGRQSQLELGLAWPHPIA